MFYSQTQSMAVDVKYSKTCVKRSLSKRSKIGFQVKSIAEYFIKQPFVIKIFVVSIFEWPFYTGCIVQTKIQTSGPTFKGCITFNLAQVSYFVLFLSLCQKKIDVSHAI